jgi:hypothetical protein
MMNADPIAGLDVVGWTEARGEGIDGMDSLERSTVSILVAQG